MPEFPDVEVYCAALTKRLVGSRLENILIPSPFLLRSVSPAPPELHGLEVVGFERMGKRVVTELENEHFMVLHLMIAGRLHWYPVESNPKPPVLVRRRGIARFDFSKGYLTLTEAGTKKRASLVLVRGRDRLGMLDPGGLEVMGASVEQFKEALQRENHTLKRSLTDPHLFSGIGNAYSDEILHLAHLSPVKWTSRLTDEEIQRLFDATLKTFQDWLDILEEQAGDDFPEKVTAFRPQMRAHGRYRKPCPECGDPVQRIVYASNETNYCPKCQTGGKLLADRALSRLLKGDWPKTLEELEEKKQRDRQD